MPGCRRIPQRRHVELVANSETGNTGLKKGPGLHALSRSLCHERCAPLEIIVPRQEEISGAATVYPFWATLYQKILYTPFGQLYTKKYQFWRFRRL